MTLITDNHDRTVTVGFEAEYQRNAAPLARELHLRDATGDDVIHGWHCECSYCDSSIYDFRVQRDSTVDGEVISRVFDDWDDAVDAMMTLQDAAIDADAEPGWDAGLHVHVAEPTTESDKARAFLAFIMWEDAITDLARGRFTDLRNMNRSPYQDTRARITALGWSNRPSLYLRSAVEQAREGDTDIAWSLFEEHFHADRHSHLSVNTRFNTWEFRIWNSTRSAWRIELACRFAVAFRDPDFVQALLDFDGRSRTRRGLLDVIAAVWQGDDRLAALVNRQLDYLPRAQDAPTRFLVA